MKKSFILFSIIVSGLINVNAQEESSKGTCYNEYYTAFRDRGARPVPDGVNEVVVSIKKDGECVCLMGQITVKNGKPQNDLMIAREDGTYEKFVYVPNPKYLRNEATFINYINNGMSPSYLSANDEVLNLFFIKYLNDQPVRYKAAPPIK